MSTANRILLIAFACLMSLGQVLFKHGATHKPINEDSGNILRIMLHPSVIAGLTTYSLATVLWIKLLQSVPLSRAYPYASLAFILVPIASALCFGEELKWQYIFGMVLIMTGIIVIGYSS